MKWRKSTGEGLLLTGLVAIAIMLFGLPVLAAEQPSAHPIGPILDSGKDLSNPDHSPQQMEPKAGELDKGKEEPMRVPEMPGNEKPMSAPGGFTTVEPAHDFILYP